MSVLLVDGKIVSDIGDYNEKRLICAVRTSTGHEINSF